MTDRRTKVRQALASILMAAFGDTADVTTSFTNNAIPRPTIKRATILVAPISETLPEEGGSLDGAQMVIAAIDIAIYTRGNEAWTAADDVCQTIEAAIAGNNTLNGTISGLAYDGFEPGDYDIDTGVYLATISYTANYLVMV